jgi:ArsR family transcriptional regulator, arsenate/arsenite/antimonite-responsive transcriptional repressor
MELTAAVTALSALGEPTRLSIFRQLIEAGPPGLVVGQIAERLTVAPATLSFHLKTLAQAGLIRGAKERQFVRYVADFPTINGLLGYLTDHCCGGNPQLCRPVTDAAPSERGPSRHAA